MTEKQAAAMGRAFRKMYNAKLARYYKKMEEYSDNPGMRARIDAKINALEALWIEVTNEAAVTPINPYRFDGFADYERG